MMDTQEEQYIEIFTSFIEQFTQGIEALEYDGKKISTGIFLINYIGKHPQCSMSDIIEFLKLIPSAATRRIDKLVDLGLVKRVSDSKDRRVVKLKLTNKGYDLYQKFVQRRLMGVKMMEHEFKPEQIKVFFKVLERFNAIKSSFEERHKMF